MLIKHFRNSRILSWTSLLLAFVIDILVPPGTAMGILYLIPMTLLLNQSIKTILSFAVLSTILIITDVVIHLAQEKTEIHYSVYGDRILSVMAVWLVFFILQRSTKVFNEKNTQKHLLLESEKMYHQLVDNLIEGAQIIGFDWKYIYVNDAVVKQSKVSKEKLIGLTMMEVYPGIEKTEMFKTLEHCMKARTPQTFENKFVYPDGSVGYFKLSIEPVEQGLFILSMDISERKKKEENQARYTKELEEMIYITSHKIRQPVAHILGLAYLVEKTQNSKDELDKMTRYMKKAAEDLDSFTAELTHFIDKSHEKNQT
jgi:PAS domain S-box-containing protein